MFIGRMWQRVPNVHGFACDAEVGLKVRPLPLERGTREGDAYPEPTGETMGCGCNRTGGILLHTHTMHDWSE